MTSGTSIRFGLAREGHQVAFGSVSHSVAHAAGGGSFGSAPSSASAPRRGPSRRSRPRAAAADGRPRPPALARRRSTWRSGSSGRRGGCGRGCGDPDHQVGPVDQPPQGPHLRQRRRRIVGEGRIDVDRDPAVEPSGPRDQAHTRPPRRGTRRRAWGRWSHPRLRGHAPDLPALRSAAGSVSLRPARQRHAQPGSGEAGYGTSGSSTFHSRPITGSGPPSSCTAAAQRLDRAQTV
jgi:hypothetical protein